LQAAIGRPGSRCGFSIKRFVAPEDIAAPAVFLASDAGRSISRFGR